MATVTKSSKKTPVRKVARRPLSKKSATAKPRLSPPRGKTAREVMDSYPDPSPEFDAAGVERIIALRAAR